MERVYAAAMSDEVFTASDPLFEEIQKLHAGLEGMKSKTTVSGHEIREALLPGVAAILQLRDSIRRIEARIEG